MKKSTIITALTAIMMMAVTPDGDTFKIDSLQQEKSEYIDEN